MASFPMESLAIILVEPQQPGNIGAVARAMGNFGVTDLRLVRPCEHLHPEAKKFAVAASPLLGSARVFIDLETAIADLQVTVATTRRMGRLRGSLVESTELPELLGGLPGPAAVGLVFGREDCGLNSEQVALCSHAARVSTSREVGSLNLAQAVLLFLYELARVQGSSTWGESDLPTQAEIAPVLNQMDEVLERIAFDNPSRPEATRYRLHQLLRRAHPDRDELGLLRGLWSQIASSINDWQGRRRG